MREPSWETVARKLYAALAECDWSYGRAQKDSVHDQINEAKELALDKQKAVRLRKRRITSDSRNT